MNELNKNRRLILIILCNSLFFINIVILFFSIPNTSLAATEQDIYSQSKCEKQKVSPWRYRGKGAVPYSDGCNEGGEIIKLAVTAFDGSFEGYEGKFPNLTKYPNLIRFDFHAAYIPVLMTGAIPNLSELKKLKYLRVESFDGYFSPETSFPNSLEELVLCGSHCFTEQDGCEVLTLYANHDGGHISNLSNLSNLKLLHLCSLGLTGRIPELYNLQSLETLSIINNKNLSGKIPDFSKNKNLTSIYLGGNNLIGSIPDLSKLDKLNRVDFGGYSGYGEYTYEATDSNCPGGSKTIKAAEYNFLCLKKGINYSRFIDSLKDDVAGLCGIEIIDPLDPYHKGYFYKDASLIEENNRNVSFTNAPEKLRRWYLQDKSGVFPEVAYRLATDGVTKVLLRVPSLEEVTFMIQSSMSHDKSGNECPYGKLLTKDGSSESCESLTVTPVVAQNGWKYAFAVYQTPSTYPSHNKDKFFVELRSIGESSSEVNTDNVKIELVPPPVLLVHGLWSSPDKWEKPWWGLKGFLERNGYKDRVFTVDYKNIQGSEFPAAESFDPKTTRFGPPQLRDKIEEVLEIYREKSISVTQVDIVGHSMGGLITRSLVKYTGDNYKYRRLDNYMQGDINKLITLGTPHHGTRVADLLVHNKCRQRLICGKSAKSEDYRPLPIEDLSCSRMTLEEYFRNVVSKPVGPAVYDLQTGSQALKNLGATDVPSHAIVGIAPRTTQDPNEIDFISSGLGDNRNTNLYLMQTFGLIAIGSKGNEHSQTINELFGGENQHDTTVSVASQQGGLTGDTVTLLEEPVTHTREPESQEAWNEILSLLREPTDSLRFAKGFPAPNLENQSNLRFADERERCLRREQRNAQ